MVSAEVRLKIGRDADDRPAVLVRVGLS